MMKPNYNWSGKVILVADDTLINFRLLATALRNTGAEMIWAQNGKEAVKICESGQQIDLVLMDIRMPEMDGYEATKIIRQSMAELPIIAQTSYAMQGNREESLEVGCTDYIAKPIILEDLKVLISTYLDKK